jgi:GH25 family lysozyme M1 (1,4-beta-N-acetylmuramidase)
VKRVYWTSAILGALYFVLHPDASTAATCGALSVNAGAVVDNEQRCKFIVHYESDNAKPDERIAHNLRLKPGDFARSIAVIVGIGKYEAKELNLEAANVDVSMLKEFLINNQHFDEVIVLEDKDATIENIRYFLRAYAIERAKLYKGKVRFLFAYSGHGVPVTAADDGTSKRAPSPSIGLALADATDAGDYNNIYGLNEIKALFEDLAKNTYQFLALINACYGGDLFSFAMQGGSPFDMASKASDAITAGPNDEVVYSAGEGHGSLFFETIIKGIQNGDADPLARDVTLGVTKDPKELYGIVRLGALDEYLGRAMLIQGDTDDDNAQDIEGNKHHFTGQVEPLDGRSLGGFFFLQAPPLSKPTALEQNSYVSSLRATSSFVPSSNQIAPATIGSVKDGLERLRAATRVVRGIDVSHWDDTIDWETVAQSDVQFAYIKATENASYVDPVFAANWAGATSVHMPHGAYHVFSFCATPEEQLANIVKTVPVESDALPIVIAAELGDGQESSTIKRLAKEAGCAKTEGGRATIEQSLRTLMSELERQYKIAPILFGNDYLLDQYLSPTFVHGLALWREHIGLISEAPPPPWAVWQYSQNERVAGIKTAVDMDVLSGGPALRIRRPTADKAVR